MDVDAFLQHKYICRNRYRCIRWKWIVYLVIRILSGRCEMLRNFISKTGTTKLACISFGTARVQLSKPVNVLGLA